MLPSLRRKKRYLAFEVLSETPIMFEDIEGAVKKSTLRLIGELGLGKSGMKMLREKWNSTTQKGVISLDHRYVDEIRASLALVCEVRGTKASLRSLYASGLLNKTQPYVDNKMSKNKEEMKKRKEKRGEI